MDYRVVWVHGIGNHKRGYADEWRKAFSRYLPLSDGDYVEVLWEAVFDSKPRARGGALGGKDVLGGGGSPGGTDVELTSAEAQAEARVRNQLLQTLQIHSAAIDTLELTEGTPPVAVPGPQRTKGAAGVTQRGLLTWILRPDEYLGDFVKYLVSRSVRDRVKAAFKDAVAPLAADTRKISVVAHSWGTVVAYDSLLDLVSERPELKAESFVTLGSPLWLVRDFLANSSGEKPANVSTWVNINARGDKIGGWMEPKFKVDRDFAVSSVKGVSPHSSYFVAANVAVQRDLVSPFVLGAFK